MEEALLAVTANIILKLQDEGEGEWGQEVEEKGGICLLLFGKRISFVNIFILTCLTGLADVHEDLPLMLA